MTYLMVVMLIGLIMGFILVASNPSPYFAALGLVIVSGMSCGVMVSHGGSFLSLVLFLIYLGGMLVVFAYSAALASELYPDTWGEWPVACSWISYLAFVMGGSLYFYEGWYGNSWVPVEEVTSTSFLRGDMAGVSFLYSYGGWMLSMGALVLLLTLFVVLELTRGLGRGALRVV